MFHTVKFIPKFLKVGSDSTPAPKSDVRKQLFTHFIIDFLEVVNQKFSKIPIEFRQEDDFSYITGSKITPHKDYRVDVYLYEDDYTATFFDMNPENWSFHAVKSGFFTASDSSEFAAQHRIFLKVSEESLINYFKEERSKEIDPSRSVHDEDYLIGILFEMFKECYYAFEYIENANGLTPAMIDSIGLDPYDFSFGIGCYYEVDATIRKYPNQSLETLKASILYDLMVERVEEKAKFSFKSSNEIYRLKSYATLLNWIDNEMAKIFNAKRYKLLNLFKGHSDHGSTFRVRKEELIEPKSGKGEEN